MTRDCENFKFHKVKTLKLLLFISLPLISFVALSEEAKDPAELQKLRAIYDAEIKRVTEVPKSRYLEALERLQATFTKDGELDEALRVKEEIRVIREESAAVPAIAINERILYGSEWLWGTGGTLTLERNGDASHTAWSVPGSWKKMRDGTISLQRPGSDPPMSVKFSDETLINAVVTSHLGTTTTIKRVVKE